MKELHLTQEPANDIGGGPAVATGSTATPEKRALAAKNRVMAVYGAGVLPSIDSFIQRRDDGVSCACVIGTLALVIGTKINADKQRAMNASDADHDNRLGLVGQVCDATRDLQIGEVLSLEEGFMNWRHGYHSERYGDLKQTAPFYKAGYEIRKEMYGQV